MGAEENVVLSGHCCQPCHARFFCSWILPHQSNSKDMLLDILGRCGPKIGEGLGCQAANTFFVIAETLETNRVQVTSMEGDQVVEFLDIQSF